MKYGAGSALPSEVMARSNSCCKVFIRTESVFPFGASVDCAPAERDKVAKTSHRKENFNADMLWKSLPEFCRGSTLPKHRYRKEDSHRSPERSDGALPSEYVSYGSRKTSF